jgi:hypothetical protein
LESTGFQVQAGFMVPENNHIKINANKKANVASAYAFATVAA